MGTEPLQARGRELLVDIEKTWAARRAESNKFRGRTEISGTVIRHIPVGTPLEDAKHILLGAGIRLQPFAAQPNKLIGGREIGAKVSPSKTEVSVVLTLDQANQASGSRVTEVLALILHTSP
jgi:hypothetical protein